MSREIKFRAWSKFPKMFLDMEDACYYLLPFGKLMQITVDKQYRAIHRELDVVVQLYTGLKDCRGTEICDGDIVKFWVDGHAKSRTAKVKFNTERGRWILFATVGHHRDLTAEKASKCEIIGNIFENSELLK